MVKNLIKNVLQGLKSLEYRFGLIADYVVERGTSGIWTYEKWESGKAVCWGITATKTVNVSTAWGSIYSGSDAYISATYPSGLFIASPISSCDLIADASVIPINLTDGTSTTSPQVQFGRGTSRTGVVVALKVIAIGRWR